MAPKGKSKAEKADVILRIYHEKKEPFNLKEIERDASKAGVVLQSIKDINQDLVHDNKVQTDKMGSGNFFWSFPSKELQNRKTRVETLEAQLQQAKVNLAAANEAKNKAESSRQASDRPTKMQRLDALLEEESKLDVVLEANKKNDPEEIKRVAGLAAQNQLAGNRWTDNVWTLKSYLVKKRGLSGKEVDKMIGIGDDFDYLDDKSFTSPKGKGKGKK